MTQCQALVFGFYYRLLKKLLVFDSVSKDAFFRIDTTIVRGFSAQDEHWQQGRPLRAPPNHFEVRVVHSRGHVVLRHAATGIYASIAEEVAIATDDIDLAVGRIRGQDVSGIVIA